MAGGPAPVRAYIDELLPDMLEGRIEPGRVYDRSGPLEEVPDGYRAMNEREVLSVPIEFLNLSPRGRALSMKAFWTGFQESHEDRAQRTASKRVTDPS